VFFHHQVPINFEFIGDVIGVVETDNGRFIVVWGEYFKPIEQYGLFSVGEIIHVRSNERCVGVNDALLFDEVTVFLSPSGEVDTFWFVA